MKFRKMLKIFSKCLKIIKVKIIKIKILMIAHIWKLKINQIKGKSWNKKITNLKEKKNITEVVVDVLLWCLLRKRIQGWSTSNLVMSNLFYLLLLTNLYRLPYVSRWGFFLDFKGGEIVNNNLDENKKKFETYPIYLKHSLYIVDKSL